MSIELNFIAGMMLGFELVNIIEEDNEDIKCLVIDVFFIRLLCFYE